MNKTRIVTILIAAWTMAVIFMSGGFGADTGKKAPSFYRVNIKSGYLIVRDAASLKGKTAGVFYAGDDCVAALGESMKDRDRTWTKVFHPYLRTTGWVDSKYVVPSKMNCKFEEFLYDTRGKADWVFESMNFPLVISSPNVDEKPTSYSKADVLASTKNLYDGPYYYLQLLDDNGMKRFWAERDGCAKYELIENKKYDVNLYKLYTIEKTAGEVSLTFSCSEMYPEFKFKETKNGYILSVIVDSGS